MDVGSISLDDPFTAKTVPKTLVGVVVGVVVAVGERCRMMASRRTFLRSVIAGSGMILIPKLPDAFRWKRSSHGVWYQVEINDKGCTLMQLTTDDVYALQAWGTRGRYRCLEEDRLPVYGNIEGGWDCGSSSFHIWAFSKGHPIQYPA